MHTHTSHVPTFSVSTHIGFTPRDDVPIDHSCLDELALESKGIFLCITQL